mmetsp:Transcript_1304/g.2838  ORF Transcript_1304/g.2838 Transcript_1304/m.2838 type:complete len:301 (-) Transcript_1304:550-1452(-)
MLAGASPRMSNSAFLLFEASAPLRTSEKGRGLDEATSTSSSPNLCPSTRTRSLTLFFVPSSSIAYMAERMGREEDHADSASTSSTSPPHQKEPLVSTFIVFGSKFPSRNFWMSTGDMPHLAPVVSFVSAPIAFTSAGSSLYCCTDVLIASSNASLVKTWAFSPSSSPPAFTSSPLATSCSCCFTAAAKMALIAALSVSCLAMKAATFTMSRSRMVGSLSPPCQLAGNVASSWARLTWKGRRRSKPTKSLPTADAKRGNSSDLRPSSCRNRARANLLATTWPERLTSRRSTGMYPAGSSST